MMRRLIASGSLAAFVLGVGALVACLPRAETLRDKAALVAAGMSFDEVASLLGRPVGRSTLCTGASWWREYIWRDESGSLIVYTVSERVTDVSFRPTEETVLQKLRRWLSLG